MSDAKEDKKKEDGKKKSGTPLSVKIAFFFILVVAVVFLPSTILFCVCMMPTFVAALIDANAQKTAWITVGAMNLAGTIPAWFQLWQDGGHTSAHAFQMAAQPSVLLTAYGSAFIGWMIYNYVTPVVAGVLVKKNEKRIRDIEKRQKELIRKWGDEVVGEG